VQFSTTVDTTHVDFTFANLSLNLRTTNFVSSITQPYN